MVNTTADLAERGASSKNVKSNKAEKKGKQQKQTPTGNTDTKGLTVSRSEDIGLWYSEMLTKAGIVSYYDVQDMCLLNITL
jgi:hypothetical protein